MKHFTIQNLFLLVFFSFIVPGIIVSQNSDNNLSLSNHRDPDFLHSDSAWVEEQMNRLSLDERIAQLLIISAFTSEGAAYEAQLANIIKKYQVGGLIFFRGTPYKLATSINKYQELVKIPLLISIDAESGLGMRIDSTISYPKLMTIGAVQDNDLIYQMGLNVGRQLKRLGIHINYAPVADVNNNPANPVINYRSFGEDPYNVAVKAFNYHSGLTDAGIISTAKHFPGHGDTESDSHKTLPVILHDTSRLDSVELFPFRYLINRGIPAVMSAHLNVPSLDSTKNLASSLSPVIIQDLLKTGLGFKGLVVTDALNMKGVSDFYAPGALEVAAFKAGNDILLMPADVHRAIQEIKKEIRKGNISENEINDRCRKVLFAKAWAGLKSYKPVQTDLLYPELNKPEYQMTRLELIAGSLTVIKNNNQILPIFRVDTCKIASLSIGNERSESFHQTLNLYTETDSYFLSRLASVTEFKSFQKELSGYNTLIISLEQASQNAASRYGITENTIKFINELDFKGKIILVVFGNPYLLSYFERLDNIDAIVIAYENQTDIKEITAQLIFGAIPAKGKLPVSIKPFYSSGTGIKIEAINRLSYGIPEEEGLNSGMLNGIDTLVLKAIRQKATPGCQILIARNSKVVYHKAFGYHTYRQNVMVKTDDLYDLASITKIAATMPAVMKLNDEKKFDVKNSLSYYLPELENSNKGPLKLNEILAHQAGLQPWIPFYYKTLEPLIPDENLLDSKISDKFPNKIGANVFLNRNIEYINGVYSENYSDSFSICVAKKLYIRNDYLDTIYRSIIDSPLLNKRQYLYSDLGYYFIQKIIEKLSGENLYTYLNDSFYSKLGASTLGYHPLERFPENRIVPTENDFFFRKQVLRGYVHDPGAALMGGIAGHSGLFGNANDLAKMMQMILNNGIYGGRIFLSDTVIQKYTSAAFLDNGNRRGLGFDRPEPDPKKISPASKSASSLSYGHTGFTGCLAWIDPQYQLIYIFLSNRIHPDQYNTKLIDMNIRTQIQDIIYQSIITSEIRSQKEQ